MLWHIVQRVKAVPGLCQVVVATSDTAADVPIRDFCQNEGISLFRGSEQDVLDRFYRAALAYQADPVVRITADCPFADPLLIGQVIARYQEGGYHHVGVATGAGAVFLEGGRFPDGLDAECFSLEALEEAWREAVDPLDREHVTPFIWRNNGRFRCGAILSNADYPAVRWTVDHEADFDLVSMIYEALFTSAKPFGMSDILAYLAVHPELGEINRAFVGREGYLSLRNDPRA